MRKIALLTLSLLSFAALASAQIPTSGNVFFGYSYYNTNLSSIDRANTNGWQASVEGKFLPWVGIVGDFSSHYGSQNFPLLCPAIGPCSFNADVTEHNYLFGPRVSVSVGKFRPFAEGMIGVGHVNVKGVTSDTSFASAIGGGIDYKLIPAVAWRLQADYVNTRFFSTSQSNLQMATGIVIRF
jgi:hypothetical protein